jgi:hypothetical protein
MPPNNKRKDKRKGFQLDFDRVRSSSAVTGKIVILNQQAAANQNAVGKAA